MKSVTAIDKLYRLDAMSSGYLMMDMRYVNSEITRHVKVTKDKYGEVELTLKLLKDCFEKQLKWIAKYNSKTDTLTNYVVKRTDFLMKKLVKLHPDIQFDFYSDVNLLLENIYSNGTSFYAVQMGLPKVFEISESSINFHRDPANNTCSKHPETLQTNQFINSLSESITQNTFVKLSLGNYKGAQKKD